MPATRPRATTRFFGGRRGRPKNCAAVAVGSSWGATLLRGQGPDPSACGIKLKQRDLVGELLVRSAANRNITHPGAACDRTSRAPTSSGARCWVCEGRRLTHGSAALPPAGLSHPCSRRASSQPELRPGATAACPRFLRTSPHTPPRTATPRSPGVPSECRDRDDGPLGGTVPDRIEQDRHGSRSTGPTRRSLGQQLTASAARCGCSSGSSATMSATSCVGLLSR